MQNNARQDYITKLLMLLNLYISPQNNKKEEMLRYVENRVVSNSPASLHDELRWTVEDLYKRDRFIERISTGYYAITPEGEKFLMIHMQEFAETGASEINGNIFLNSPGMADLEQFMEQHENQIAETSARDLLERLSENS